MIRKPGDRTNRAAAPLVGYVEGFGGELRPADPKRFYRVRLTGAAIDKLGSFLEARPEGERAERVIAATAENVNRLRVMTRTAPAYEVRAQREYVRGDILTVRGKTSISIYVRIPDGGRLLRQRLDSARQRMLEWVELRANRLRNLLEIVPDADLISREDSKLGEAGAGLAAVVLPDEDFRDWERAGG